MSKRASLEPDGALYVRLPAAVVDRLQRATEVLGVHKKDLVERLVTAYVDPDTQRGRDALGVLSQPKRLTVDVGAPTRGAYTFQASDPVAVMTVEQTAELLQLEAKVVLEMAEAGKLPGKKLGAHWRFSRAAILAWLSVP